MEDSITTLYIGKYSEAELGTGTTYLVFVPELEQAELPNKLYLPMILNGAGTGNSAPQVGPGFYLMHPITPNQESITWRMYYYADGQPSGEGKRIAMRVANMPVSQPQPTPTPQPYPAPTPTQSAYQENIFDRFVTFLKDLFDVKAVSAAPLLNEAPVGEVYFLLTDHLPLKGCSASHHEDFS